MKIFSLLQHADRATIIFIIISIIVLSLVQYLAVKVKSRFCCIVLIAVIQGGFGYFLSRVSEYNIYVHLIIYLLPSIIIAIILRYVLGYTMNQPAKNDFKFTYEVVKGSSVTVNNIFRSVALIGGAGSGKTKSIIKPTIKQMAKQNFCGAIYDYKKYDLAKTAYTHYLDSEVEFKGINFFDLSKSYQINPISPKVIISPAYANDAANVLVANLSKQSSKEDPFFVEAASSAIAGTIWKLKEDYPEYSYLPYVVSILLQKSTKDVANFLQSNQQSSLLGSPFIKSVKSDRQSSGIEATISNALRKIALPEIFWVLSGDDIELDLNNPAHPTLLCLSNYMKLDSSYAPVIALILDMCSKCMSEPRMQQSGFIIEEGSTILLPNLAKIPATLREYMVFVLFCIQDITQGEELYQRLGIKKLLANLGTHIYGRVMDMETAESYAKMYGKYFQRFTSRTRKGYSVTASSYTDSERQTYIKEPTEFMHLEPGEFFGLVAEGNVKKFHSRFKEYNEQEFDLPFVKKVNTQMVDDNFNKILSESEAII